MAASRRNDSCQQGWGQHEANDAASVGVLPVVRHVRGIAICPKDYLPARKGKPRIVPHDAIKMALQQQMSMVGVCLKGLGFYGLRRSFETIGAEAGDQVAIDHIMGHVPHTSEIGALYRHHVSESALRQVMEHVRAWLFGNSHTGRKGQK